MRRGGSTFRATSQPILLFAATALVDGRSLMHVELMVKRCLIFLIEKDNVTLALNKGFLGEDELKTINDPQFHSQLLTVKDSILIDDKDESKIGQLNKDLRIAALFPMRIQNETKGVVVLGEKITNLKFNKDELNFLTTLGNLSMISV